MSAAKGLHPLTPFVHWNWSAPYEGGGGRDYPVSVVFPVKSKSGLAASRKFALVHRAEAVAAFLIDGKLQYGARWMCRDGSADAVLVANAEAHGGLCERCKTAVPVVYRCFDADRRLLYVGSTLNTFTRFQAHEKRSPWWADVKDISTEEHPDLTAARIAEAAAIRREHPARNKMLRRREQSS